ncbi:M48 family metallopeptidase [Synechococcus sp. PCC 6312]|uniref:M48 family metallopeptidase n=1 Tax=Synechococcus sp. (strain ATCC 27167 / PCC 6312) TaxID=195253 RepID=UPI00029F35E4|nr:M48 family metallopeptidase [Synechococcus sp. PCC 6312]AFY62448.1 Peptidase family M48 [Synechococcus sp. PCC 6312]
MPITPRQNRWFKRVAAVSLALSVLLHPLTAQAQSVLDRILFQGIQLLQVSNISPQQEVAIGRQINQQMLSQGMRVNNNPQLQSYINQIGQRLVAVSARKNIPYTFQVVNDRAVNAFATMGGFVYVTTGLIATADNEAELAGVIGHEMGHIEQRHVIRQMQQTLLARGLLTAAGLDRDQGVQMAAELAFRRPRSRQDELEADRVGLILLARSNYATIGLPSFLTKLARNPAPPAILSTHPAARDRAIIAEQLIQSGINNNCPNTPQELACGLDSSIYQQDIRSRFN